MNLPSQYIYMSLTEIHTLHSTLYTVPCTLYTSYFTLYTPHCTLYALHCALDTLHFPPSLYTLQSPLYTLHFALCPSHSTPFTPYTLHPTLSTLNSRLYTPHSTLCTVGHVALEVVWNTSSIANISMYFSINKRIRYVSMAGRAKENLPEGNLKYQFVYLGNRIRIFRCNLFRWEYIITSYITIIVYTIYLITNRFGYILYAHRFVYTHSVNDGMHILCIYIYICIDVCIYGA